MNHFKTYIHTRKKPAPLLAYPFFSRFAPPHSLPPLASRPLPKGAGFARSGEAEPALLFPDYPQRGGVARPFPFLFLRPLLLLCNARQKKREGDKREGDGM